MDSLDELRQLLSGSSDEDNPPAEEVARLLRESERIGVIGLSRFPEKAARRVPSYLAAKGYEVVPINPNASRLLGREVFDRLSAVPGPLDIVLVFRPSDRAGPFVEEAMLRPERPAIWLQEGIRADPEIGRARAHGITAIQDVCAFRAHRALFD